MPTLDATTTAVFTAVGISASSIYAVFLNLVGIGISFILWLMQVAWPFLLVLAFIGMLFGIALAYRRRAGMH